MLHKELYELENGQKVRFSIFFKKGRGYVVSVVPVKITQGDGYQIEEFGAFTGFIDTLLEIDRQSSKRLKSAIDLIPSRLNTYLDNIRVRVGLLTLKEYQERHVTNQA